MAADGMRIFGKDFEALDHAHLEDLFSLEREQAIYADHWIDELGDFRHIRIALSREESDEYVRRMWAYELFLRSDADWARDVPGIDEDIAEEADNYRLLSEDERTDPGPDHCAAAFLGIDLEILLCSHVPERQIVIETLGTTAFTSTLRQAIDSLTPAIRSFNRRERGLSPWTITCEDDVRDLLYAMLRPAVADLRREEAVPSNAGTHKFADFCSNLARTLIEVKWIGKPGRWRAILDEIRVDTQTYASHPSCSHLVFIVVDAVRDIPDPALVEAELSGPLEIRGRKVDVTVYVREP